MSFFVAAVVHHAPLAVQAAGVVFAGAGGDATGAAGAEGSGKGGHWGGLRPKGKPASN